MPVLIRLGGYQKPASVHNRAAAFFGEALGRRLGERIAFELIGNVLELGRNSGELPTMVESGELSACYMSTVRFAQAVPELKLLELPFLVEDRTCVFAALDGELGNLLRRRFLESTPFRILGFWDNGFRHLSNRVRPIRTPADCCGMRIRTQMSALHGEVFRALGFEPIAADIRDFIEGIATERFEAQDNPLTNIFNFGVHAHHRFITLTGHFFGVSLMLFNESHYRSWPPEVQAAVEDAAREATAVQRDLAAAEDAGILRKLDPHQNEVIRLSATERAAFVKAVQPVLAKYRQRLDPRLFAYLSGNIPSPLTGEN